MTKPDPQRVRNALVTAGLEIYSAKGREILVAERVRLHLMDSGVRILVNDSLKVLFTVRAQQSDFPEETAQELISRVRGYAGPEAQARGYAETSAGTIEIRHPADLNRLLDIWHEVTFEKVLASEEDVVRETRWALSFEKCVHPSDK